MVGCEMDGQTGGRVMPVIADERGQEHPTTGIHPVHQQEVQGSGIRQLSICLIIQNVIDKYIDL